MITKLHIRDNSDSPIHYVNKVFKNGFDIEFTPGINIVVGENGSGKTTLVNLLKYYLMVGDMSCTKGMYNSNVTRIAKHIMDSSEIYRGVDVYADYNRNTFAFTHDKSSDTDLSSIHNFVAMVDKKTSSTGESVLVDIKHLSEYMFSIDASQLTFDYASIGVPDYQDYIDNHRVTDCPEKWTLIMDEPDRNLSLKNIQNLEKEYLSEEHPQCQLIAVIHNPMIIMSLQKYDNINWIELTDGYIDKLKKKFIQITNRLIKKDDKSISKNR